MIGIVANELISAQLAQSLGFQRPSPRLREFSRAVAISATGICFDNPTARHGDRGVDVFVGLASGSTIAGPSADSATAKTVAGKHEYFEWRESIQVRPDSFDLLLQVVVNCVKVLRSRDRAADAARNDAFSGQAGL
jgi:hypothetical protein